MKNMIRRALVSSCLVLMCLGFVPSMAARVVGPDGIDRLKIDFDYRFAGTWFDPPERRKTLEAAADVYARLIKDDFPTVPKGTVMKVWNYQTEAYVSVKLDKDIDDVLVFVYAQDYAGSTKAAALPLYEPWEGRFKDRYSKYPFRPWAMSVWVNTSAGRPWFFDQTPETEDDMPSATHYDFFETVLHELGHAFGLIRNQSPFPFTDLVKDDYFYGTHVVAANGQKPVRLAKDSSHIYSGFNSYLSRPDIDRYMMHPSNIVQGFRSWPKSIDLAMLEDIGYTLDPIEKQKYLKLQVTRYDERPLTKDLGKISKPTGLWLLNDPENPLSPVLGYPLRYVPPSDSLQKLTTTKEGAFLPKNSHLIVDHGIVDSADKKSGRSYSIGLDLWVDKLGDWIGLYNTEYTSTNEAEAWIDPLGRIGQGNFSSEVITEKSWHRLIIVVDGDKSQRRFYLDGDLVLSLTTQVAGSRFELYTRTPSGGAALLVIDGGYWLDKVAFWPRALSDTEANALGDFDQPIQ